MPPSCQKANTQHAPPSPDRAFTGRDSSRLSIVREPSADGQIWCAPYCGPDARFLHGWPAPPDRRASPGTAAALAKQHSHALHRQFVVRLCSANSNMARTCSRPTPGNHSRKSSIVGARPRGFRKRDFTGTRVPRNTHAPLILATERSTAKQRLQSNIIMGQLQFTLRRAKNWNALHCSERSGKRTEVGPPIIQLSSPPGGPASENSAGRASRAVSLAACRPRPAPTPSASDESWLARPVGRRDDVQTWKE